MLETRREFTCMVRRMLGEGHLQGIGPKFIANMDQTPVFFESNHASTVDQRGARTVEVLTAGQSKCRVTVTLTILADGSKLPPFIIFKAAVKGRVAREVAEFESRLPFPAVCITHPTAWQDTENMKDYIEKVLP
jgi:hypothetical protein